MGFALLNCRSVRPKGLCQGVGHVAGLGGHVQWMAWDMTGFWEEPWGMSSSQSLLCGEDALSPCPQCGSSFPPLAHSSRAPSAPLEE